MPVAYTVRVPCVAAKVPTFHPTLRYQMTLAGLLGVVAKFGF